MIPVPLCVRLKTARGDKHITRDLRSLTFRSTAPGGFASATFSLNRPLSVQPDEIAYYASAYIYDGRNGSVVWEGRLEDPGRSAGVDGQVWEITAVGSMAHASDRKVPRILADQSVERWRRHSSTLRNAQTSVEGDDDGTTSLTFTFNEGSTVSTGQTATMYYRALRETGQFLARVRAEVDDGGTSSLWEDRLLTQNSGGTTTTVHSDTWNTTARFIFGERGHATQAIPSGHDIAFYRSIRVGAGGTASSASNSRFDNVAVRAILKDKTGADITSGYTVNYVLAHEVVHDLLGGLLAKYDGTNASVDTSSTFQIDQFAYPDGATSAEMLDDLMVIVPAYYWVAWESNSDGLYRFEWKAWPSTVRYEADVTGGFSGPGSASQLFNAVNVRWRSPAGNIRIRSGTQTVDELTDAGLTREETIDLGDNIGSSAIGDQARDQFLAEHATVSNAGTLTIDRKILDTQTGRMVDPWEIRPGTLIRVRGILPRVDSLNATARDGVTVFKIVSVEFDAATATAQLELDSYSYSTARALANLEKRRTRRR